MRLWGQLWGQAIILDRMNSRKVQVMQYFSVKNNSLTP